MATILVTGSSGFIGRHLVPHLRSRGHVVVETGRASGNMSEGFWPLPAIGPQTDWAGLLGDIDCVVHLAGLAHRAASDEQFFSVNVGGTRRLAEACHGSPVRNFVFLSSIAARRAEASPDRSNAYALSKLWAELHVTELMQKDAMSFTILRPPLVYGHDAPGNWQRLQRLAVTPLPLPFGAVRHRRSLCSVGNLCSAIAAAVEAGLQVRHCGIYEIADAEPISLAEAVTWLREGMGRSPRLLPVPPPLLRAALGAVGRKKLAESLLDDLVLDPAPSMQAFGWTQPENAEEAVRESGRLFMQSRSGD